MSSVIFKMSLLHWMYPTVLVQQVNNLFYSQLYVAVGMLFVCCFYAVALQTKTNEAAFAITFFICRDLLNTARYYLFKANNRNTRTSCEIYLKLTIKTPERSQWHRSGVFVVNFEHTSYPVLVPLLLTFSRQMPTGNSP